MSATFERRSVQSSPVHIRPASLIATINESLAIADEGKARRATAEADLIKMEADLRDTLASARARQTAPVAAT